MDFITWAERLGIPMAIIIALALALWRTGVWMGANVVKPLAERHIKFMDSLEVRIGEMTIAHQRTAGHIADIADEIKEIRGRVVQAGSVVITPSDAHVQPGRRGHAGQPEPGPGR